MYQAVKGSNLPLTDASKDRIRELAVFYRNHLLADIMPFWEKRTKDDIAGGYLTCFDRKGNLTDENKYIWFQARQLYMFSAMYNRIEKDKKWLDLAKWGRDFLVKYAYAGDGRWYYQLDREGGIQKGTISVYTDLFMLKALCEYAKAGVSDEDLCLINETYDTLERNLHNPNFKAIYHGTWSPKYKRHGLYMISLIAAHCAANVLGNSRTRRLIDHCLEQILYVFAKDEYEALFESVGWDGCVIFEPEGLVVNPGHTMESMWFVMEEALSRKSPALFDRAVRILDWACKQGFDEMCGGIYSYLDALGGVPLQTTWHTEVNASWDDKVWWVHSEALYALALVAVEKDSQEHFDRFIALHDFCQKYFFDRKYGEWYAELYRDGSPKLTDKGTLWKACYHLPRAIMMTANLFERYTQNFIC